MIELDLLRHAQVAGEPALYGATNINTKKLEGERLLTSLVFKQKSTNAYDAIISSPLLRCQNLAKQLADECQLPLTIIDNLQEMNFGIFDGVPFDDIPYGESLAGKAKGNTSATDSRLHWSMLERFFEKPAEINLPNGETLSGFHLRVSNAWQNIIEQQLSLVLQKKPSEMTSRTRRVLVIAHGGVIRMIIANILKSNWQLGSWHQNLKISNASLSQINVSLPQLDNNGDAQYPVEKINQQVNFIGLPLLKENT